MKCEWETLDYLDVRWLDERNQQEKGIVGKYYQK